MSTRRFFHHAVTGLALASVVSGFQRPVLAATALELEQDAAHALQALYKNNATAELLGKKAKGILVFPRIIKAGLVLLLADEPTGNLDTQSAKAIFELLQSFSEDHRTTVLFVTHNPALSSRCKKTIQVVDGHVLSAKTA